MARREEIVVGVEDRILWVGDAAYPLHNIARAQTLKLVPDRAAALRRWLGWTLVWAAIGVAAAVSADYAETQGYWSAPVVSVGSEVVEPRVLIAVAVLTLVGLHTIRLILVLARRTYYALVIETAGYPEALLVSPDRPLIEGTVRRIIAAINDPGLPSFRVSITNYHIGDTVHGDRFGGDKVIGNKIMGSQSGTYK